VQQEAESFAADPLKPTSFWDTGRGVDEEARGSGSRQRAPDKPTKLLVPICQKALSTWATCRRRPDHRHHHQSHVQPQRARGSTLFFSQRLAGCGRAGRLRVLVIAVRSTGRLGPGA